MKLIDYINCEERSYMLPFMATNGLKLTGYTLDEVYGSPEKQLEVAIKMDEIFEADFIYPMDFGSIFCETLGLQMKKSDYDFPLVVEHPVKNEETLSQLKVLDPYKDGRMPTNLKSLELIAKNFNKPLQVSVPGPFTLAVNLGGAEHVLKSIIKNPGYIEKLLNYSTEVVLRYVKAVEKTGVKFISIAEPSSIMISPKRYEKLAAKNLRYILENINCWKGVHICGDTIKILDFMMNFGVDALSFDQIMDLPKIAKIIPEDIVIIGNVDPIEVLGKMKPEEIKEETLQLIRDMRPYRNYLAAFGCNCLNDTPVENLKAVIEAGRIKYFDL